MALDVASYGTDYVANDSDQQLDITAPSGITTGDLLITIISCGPSRDFDTATGWTLLDDTAQFKIWYKVAVSADESAGSYTWTDSQSYTKGHGICLRITDADTSGAPTYNTAAEETSYTDEHTSNDATVSENGSMVLWIASNEQSGGTTPTIDSCTKGSEVYSSNPQDDVVPLAVYQQDSVSSGTEAGPTWAENSSNGGDKWSQALIIEPAAAGFAGANVILGGGIM